MSSSFQADISECASKPIWRVQLPRFRSLASLGIAAFALVGCSGGFEDTKPKASFVGAEGQVTVADTSPENATAYAAARFLEQASWGPTPESITEVQRLGISGWIDDQIKLPATQLNAPNYVINHDIFNQPAARLARNWFQRRFYDTAIGGKDQLRQRVAWALFNFVPKDSGQPYSQVSYYNLFQRHALGSYRDFLIALSRDPGMGHFLNNNQNTSVTPNENYARELMQLFSVGLVKLNIDGSVQRDSKGVPIETYTQRDVVAATKALSGWDKDWEPNLPDSNFMNFGKPMVPRNWDKAHDTSAKTIMGITIPANQTIYQDLESVVDILMKHPNIAPFVSKRLIQNLTTSDPSPAYLARVATVFKNTQGDLSQVVKAILTDKEARRGDILSAQASNFGRIKEPLLFAINVYRSLGCKVAVQDKNSDYIESITWQQRPFDAPSVFGFVSPDYRSPETNTPAPEQYLLNANEFNSRLNSVGPFFSNDQRLSSARDSGCLVDEFIAAASLSDEAFLSLVNERFFKGVMPSTLRQGAKTLLSESMGGQSHRERVNGVLQILLATPTYGVVR